MVKTSHVFLILPPCSQSRSRWTLSIRFPGFLAIFGVESRKHDQVASNSYGGNIDFYWAAMPNFTVRQAVIGRVGPHAALFGIGSRIRSKSAFGGKILRRKHVGVRLSFHVLLLKVVRSSAFCGSGRPPLPVAFWFCLSSSFVKGANCRKRIWRQGQKIIGYHGRYIARTKKHRRTV